jgi:hypothetical protein
MTRLLGRSADDLAWLARTGPGAYASDGNRTLQDDSVPFDKTGGDGGTNRNAGAQHRYLHGSDTIYSAGRAADDLIRL